MNNTTIIPVLSALIPALALLGYIYWQDRKSPEPWRKLINATALGVLAIPITLIIVLPLQAIGLVPDSCYTFGEVVNISFFGAAIPEELAKLLMLWLFLRKNPFFDERMDGIVYAVVPESEELLPLHPQLPNRQVQQTQFQVRLHEFHRHR